MLSDCEDGARVGRVRSVEISPTELRFESESEAGAILVDARTWFRWQQEDPDFWKDDSNVKKILKDNKELTPWKQ